MATTPIRARPCATRRLRAFEVVVEPAPLTEASAAVTAEIVDLSG